MPVSVELAGARTFVLRVEEGGGGAGIFDPGDWAAARVELADGRTLWLDELPVLPNVWGTAAGGAPEAARVWAESCRH